MSNNQKGPLFTGVVLEIFKLGGLLINEGDRMTAEFGITSARWKILGSLALADARLTVPQIAKTMGQTRQAVQRLVDAMQRDGILEFNQNPEHKRAKLISLSNKGQDIYAKLDTIQAEWAKESAGPLKLKELETTLTVLKKMTTQFET